MKGDIIRGHTENIILSILKEKDMYGYQILEMISNKTNHELELKKITLYKTLERMEKNELIEQTLKVDKTTNGGKRKYYKITSKGLDLLKQNIYNWNNTKEIISYLISDLDYVVFDKNLISYDEVKSTNDIAKELIKEGIPEGTIIVAKSQTKGRGRLNRHWIDEKGKNILMSIIVYPKTSLSSFSKITQVAAASVFSALSEFELNVKIKWPNDVLVNNKKISGILVETSVDNDCVNYAIVGIGINVNMDVRDTEISNIATSIFNETNKEIDNDKVLKKVIEKFNYYYNEFLKGNDLALSVCRENSHIIGKLIKLEINNDIYKVRVKDIADDGKLVVQNPNGTIEYLSLNEVSLHSNY